MEDKIKAAVKVAMRHAVIEIVEETIEDAFAVGFDDEKEGIKTSIRIMLDGALIDIIGQCHLDNILVSNVDKLDKYTRLMDGLKQRVVGNTSTFYANCSICQETCRQNGRSPFREGIR